MNIVLASPRSIILTGILETLSVMGENTVKWNEGGKPAFDMVDELKPDVVLVERPDMSEALLAALEAKKQIMLIIYGVHVPEELSEHNVLLIMPKNTPPIIEKNIGEDTNKTRWQDAANILAFISGSYNSQYESDVLFINTYQKIPQNALKNVSAVLVPCKYRCKISGPLYFPSPIFIGASTQEETRDLAASTKITLDYDFKLALDLIVNKRFVLSNVPNGITPHFTSNEHLLSQLDIFLSEEKLRRKEVREGRKLILGSHTFFHRVDQIGELLEVDWVSNPLDILNRVIK